MERMDEGKQHGEQEDEVAELSPGQNGELACKCTYLLAYLGCALIRTAGDSATVCVHGYIRGIGMY